MSDSEGIKYSKFKVVAVHFDDAGYPSRVDLLSHYFTNEFNNQISTISMAAALKSDEAETLMMILNGIGMRVENDLRSKL